jgi:hypothetical protein
VTSFIDDCWSWQSIHDTLLDNLDMVLIGLLIFLAVFAFFGIIFLIWCWKQYRSGPSVNDVADGTTRQQVQSISRIFTMYVKLAALLFVLSGPNYATI